MKKRISLALSMILTASMAVTAFATEINDSDALSADATVTTKVDNPTYKVTVPTTVDFAIDAFETQSKGQIYSTDLIVKNESNVAVKVTATAKATAGADVTLVAADEVNATDSTVTDKQMYLALTAAAALDSTKAKIESYATEGDVAITAEDSEMALKLAKGDADATYAALGITGKANPAAAWATGDMSVALSYDVTGLTPAMETALETVDGTLGLVRTTPAGPAIKTISDTVSASADASFKITGVDSSATIKSIYVASLKATFPVESYTYSNGLLTFVHDKGSNPTLIGMGSASYDMVIAMSDGTTLNATIKYSA